MSGKFPCHLKYSINPCRFFPNIQRVQRRKPSPFFSRVLNQIKREFPQNMLKIDSQLLNHPFLIDYNLFNEDTKSLIPLTSYFLGMDTNNCITEPLLSLIFTLITSQVGSEPLTQSMQSSHLKFDELLANNIHS